MGRFLNHNTVHVLANHQLIGQNLNLFSITFRFFLKLSFLNYTAFLFSYVYSYQGGAIRNPYAIKAMILKHCFNQFVLDISVIFSQIYCLSICDQGRGISRTFSWYFAANFTGKRQKWRGFREFEQISRVSYCILRAVFYSKIQRQYLNVWIINCLTKTKKLNI